MTVPAPKGAARPLAAARAVSLAEASSFLLLLVATGIKYGADHPIGVQILGPVHGVLFLTYCGLIAYVATTRRWPRRQMILALVASVLPVAPFFVERHWLRDDARVGRATTGPGGSAGRPGQGPGTAAPAAPAGRAG